MPGFASATAVIFLSSLALCLAGNWDGDNPAGNFSYNNNWYSDSQPTWGGSNTHYFSYRNNASQTSLYYDYGSWVDCLNFIYESTFGAGLPLDGNGNGINVYGKLENQGSYSQTINIPISMKTSSAQINPVNGNLTFNNYVYNNSNWINVWGNNGKTLALYGVLSDAGGLAVKENSTVILANDNTFSGGIWVEKGTVRLQTHTNAVGTGSVNVGTNATLDINYGAVHVRGVALTLYNGKVSKTVTGSTYWDGAFTNYNSSTVSVSAGNFIIISNMSLNSGTLVFSNVFNSGMNGGTMTGSGNLIKQGLGAFFLFPGTHSGNIDLYQGEIRQFTGTMTGSGTLTMSNATTYRTDGTTTRTNTKAIVIKGNVTNGYVGGGTLIFTGTVNLNSGIRTITCPNTNTISGVISSGGLNKDGVGMLILSADNSYASTNTVSNGVLRISSTWALGSHTAGTIVQSGAALELTGGIATPAEPLSLVGTGINNGGALRNISGNNSYNGPITLTGLTRINSDSGTLQLGADGDVSGAGQTLIVGGTGVVDIWGDLPTGSATFIKDGTGTNTLNYSSATRTWTGPTYINEGVIQLTAANGISDNSAMTISNGATFNMAAGNDTIGSIAGTGTIVMGNSTLTCGGNNSNTVFAGVMSGAGGVLTKTGSGTLTLSGTSTHGGNTTVSAGTLIQNGTNSSSAVTVSSGAFLYGGGQVADLNIFGCVSPGTASNTAGKLKAAAVTLPMSGKMQIDLSAMSGTAGVNWDLLEGSGNVTVGANSANRFTIALKGDPTGFSASEGWTNTIITGGSMSGFDATDFTITTTEFVPSLDGGTFSLYQDGSSIRLLFTPMAGGAPGIAVLGTNITTTISDGDTTPAREDGTDFGTVALEGSTKEHTFTITNEGTGLLFVDNVAVGGAHASDFTVTGVPAIHTNNLLLNGDFALDGTPAQLGTAVINNWTNYGTTRGYYNNDIDGQMSVKIWWDDTGIYQDFSCVTGAVYLFSIYGRHTTAESLAYWHGYLKAEFYDASWTKMGEQVLDDLKPTDPLDQWILMKGSATSPAGSVYGRMFLSISNWNASAGGAAYFDNASVGCMNLLGHSTTTFRVTFDPSAIGARTGTVYITNNVTGKSPYDFVIKGTGAPPDMDVLGTNGAVIADGDTTPTQVDGTDFGTVALSGGSKLHTYMITNTGPCVIRASDVVIGGTHASDFAITQQTFNTIAYNLIATNPSFEANATAWNMDANCAVAQEHYGVYAEHGTNFMMAWWENVSYMDVPVIPGSTYVWSAWVTTPAGCAETMSNNLYGLLKMEWMTAAKASISSTQLTFYTGTTYNVQITPGTWKNIAITSAAPATAAFLRAGWGAWHDAANSSGRALFDEMVCYQLPGVRGTSTFSIVFDPSATGVREAYVYITNSTTKNPYDFKIQGSGMASLNDPSGVQAWRDGHEMVRMQWTNYSSYGVIVVHRQTNAPTALTQGVAYNVGDAVGTDGTRVVAKQAAGTWVEHILQPGSTNHYIFYTYDGNNYSPGVADSTNLLQYMTHEIVDEFCYTGGVTTALNGLSGGHGWSNSWNANAAFTIISNDTPNRPEFFYMWPYPDRGGNRIRLPDQGSGIWNVEAYRNFPKVTNGTLFLAGRMAMQSNGANRWCGFSVVTGSTHMTFFGESWASDGFLALSDHGGGIATNRIRAWGGGAANLTNTYLVIGRYDFSSRVFCAVSYPGWTNAPASEPNWGICDTIPVGELAYIDGIGIKAGCSDAAGMSPGECFFDEIRVAPTWADLFNASRVWVTNYSVDGDNQITDAQVTSGAFSVTFWTQDPSSPGNNLDYDLLNPSGTAILNDNETDYKSWYENNTMMVASDSVHSGYSTGTLGVYTTRYSAAGSNGFWQYDIPVLSNGTWMTFTVGDDDAAGPTASLLYVGTNYTPGAFATNTTDGALSSGGMLDIAVLLSDPSGIWFATNDFHNINNPNGNVQPNWDLTNSVNQDFGYDRPFTNFIGYSGAASVTAVVYNVAPINPTNLAMDSMWTLTISGDDLDLDRGTWLGCSNSAVSYDRTTTTNYPLYFWVTDDDKAPPALAVPQIGMTMGGTNIGNLLTDGNFDNVTPWTLYSVDSAKVTNSAGENGSNGILFWQDTLGGWPGNTNDHGGFFSEYTIRENVSSRYLFSIRGRSGNDPFDCAMLVLKYEFLNNTGTLIYQTETNIVSLLTDTWKTFWFSATSTVDSASIRVIVDFNTANATVGTHNRTSMWDSVRLYWADLTDTNPILRVTDGQLVQASAANPFHLDINAYDADSGLSRGTTLINSQSFVSVQHLTTNNLANYTAAASSPNTLSANSTNIWSWATSLGNVDNYMFKSNVVVATLRDADTDRVSDQLSVSNITAGYFFAVDDDTNRPARGFMETQELLLNGGFETNGANWSIEALSVPYVFFTNYAAETGAWGWG